MCQLLGMNGNTPTDIMFSFTGFATRAEEHQDGFGIAFFEGAGLRLFVDAQSARHSPVAWGWSGRRTSSSPSTRSCSASPRSG